MFDRLQVFKHKDKNCPRLKLNDANDVQLITYYELETS